MVCLRTELPEVQAQLDKYTSILGSEDAAYYVLSENNGYDLDKAPNGQPSKLFSDLLSHFQGDENAAILAKSKVFTEGFKMRSEGSVILDENGELTIDSYNAITENGSVFQISAYRNYLSQNQTRSDEATDPTLKKRLFNSKDSITIGAMLTKLAHDNLNHLPVIRMLQRGLSSAIKNHKIVLTDFSSDPLIPAGNKYASGLYIHQTGEIFINSVASFKAIASLFVLLYALRYAFSLLSSSVSSNEATYASQKSFCCFTLGTS